MRKDEDALSASSFDLARLHVLEDETGSVFSDSFANSVGSVKIGNSNVRNLTCHSPMNGRMTDKNVRNPKVLIQSWGSKVFGNSKV